MAYSIGIDIGTTKVAVILIDANNNLLACVSAAHHADIPTNIPNIAEQDVKKLFDCIFSLLLQLPPDLRIRANRICMTGQMHSITFKKPDGKYLPLVTWQDTRCGREFLTEVNSKSGLKLCEGFGGTTMARMVMEKQMSDELRATSVVGALASTLTNSERMFIDPTFAASWGIYDIATNEWNFKALKSLDIPLEILPEIRPSGAVLGTISPDIADQYGLSQTLQICNGIGDNQASILGTGSDFSKEIYLTIGTGAQLSMVCDAVNAIGKMPELDHRPFPDGKILLVNAPLCGGSSFAMLADVIAEFQAEFGLPKQSKGEILDKLDELALAELREHGIPDISVAPHFCGERYNAKIRGSITGLDLKNCTPQTLAAAFAVGVIETLKTGFSENVLRGRTKIICSGNGVRLMKSVQYAIQLLFGIAPTLSDAKEEAARGCCTL